MKTYGLLILLLLTCFISNAQDVKRKEHKQKNNVSSVLEIEKKSTNNLNHLDVKSIIVRASDFKIYMNRKRKIQNIKVLFPKINMEKKA